jgi:hypothetical protein
MSEADEIMRFQITVFAIEIIDHYIACQQVIDETVIDIAECGVTYPSTTETD